MCGSCEASCPVFIEHPRMIVDLRRHLVDQGQVDEGLQDALTNLNRYGNSFGQSAPQAGRMDQGPRLHAQGRPKEEVEYLWFVGDYASYDPRVPAGHPGRGRDLPPGRPRRGNRCSTRSKTPATTCAASARKACFELLREKNLQALEKASFQRVVTTDPHTYNALKNEYGGRRAAWDGERGQANAAGGPASAPLHAAARSAARATGSSVPGGRSATA